MYENPVPHRHNRRQERRQFVAPFSKTAGKRSRTTQAQPVEKFHARNRQTPIRHTAQLLVALIFAGCATTSPPLYIINGETMLLGEIAHTTLHREFPLFAQNEAAYTPDPEILDQIRTQLEGITLELYLGTWCDDSQSEAPKALRIQQDLGENAPPLRIFAVDRNKHERTGMAEKRNIERVPTAIMFHNGVEKGRIVEYPSTTMEQNFAIILSR